MAQNNDFDKILSKGLSSRALNPFRGDEQIHPAKLSASDHQMLGVIQSMQQELVVKKAKNPNIHLPIPDSMLTVNPATLSPAALSGFLSALVMATKEVGAEEAENTDSPKKGFLESCKKFLLGKKHCHDNPVVPVVSVKDLGALKPVFEKTPQGFFDGKNTKNPLRLSVNI